MDGQMIDKWTYGWMNKWIDGQTDTWMNKWMDGWILHVSDRLR